MNASPAKVLLPVFLAWTILSGAAAADDVVISGLVPFGTLDGSAQDHDGAVNGVFTVADGNLVIDGTVHCNDDPPLPGHASACPIRISVSGDLVVEAGGAIQAENRSGGGNGGSIALDTGGDLIVRGPSGLLPGAVVSSGSLTSSGAAGAISATVGGAVELEAGSTLSASASGGSAGAVGIEAGGAIRIAGLVASGPGTSLLASRWSEAVLGGGSNGQKGGTILLRSTSTAEPGILVEATGTIASQGQSSGPQFVLLEACGIEVHGLVAAVSRTDTPARIVLRSGKGILVDGSDLAVGSGSHLGRVRADSIQGGAATHLVDLFAEANIQTLGPALGTTDLFAVSANPGTQAQRTGGSVSAISLSGTLAASGNAFDAGRALSGNKGGKIDLRSAGDAVLEDAHLRAVGGYLTSSGSRRGGQISVRSFSGEVRWTFATGDVRPTGSGASASSRGTITLTACAGIDTTGTSFPVLGSPVAPFPVEADGVCTPAAPSLPSGEPPLPNCNEPPMADDQAVTTDEDTAINITLTGSDPNGDSLTFSIETPPAHGSLGPFTSPTATSVQVAYTPDLNYSGPDSFVFQVDDGNGGTDSATVEITVEAVDDAPEAVDDSATVAEDAPATTIDVLANDTDVDGGSKSIFSVTQPANGAVVITNDGADLTYQPAADYCDELTPDVFTYTLSPGSSTATVSVTVTCEDDPPSAVEDAVTVAEDSGPNLIDVLANDTDGDGGPKSVGAVTQPANGSVSIVGGGTGVSYEPAPNYCGASPDVFTYTLSPGVSTATVSVTVSCVDDAPVAVADAATVQEDAPATAIDVLANDTDVDGGSKFVESVTPPASGVVAITGLGTGVTYQPNPNYCNNPPGTLDTFTYTLNGGSSATVSVAVTCVNDGPALADATLEYTVLGNTQLRVGESTLGNSVLHIRDNDDVIEKSSPSDIDGPGPFTVVPFAGNTGKGDLVLNADGTFTYEPNAGFVGTDIIAFSITDNGAPAAFVNGTITITVANTVWYVHDVTGPDNPEAGDDGRSTNAFEDLEDVATVVTADDYIFVFEGNSGTAPHGGIKIDKTGVKLLGEGVGLTVPGFGTLVPAGNRPAIDNEADIPVQEDHGVFVNASASSLAGIEIRGLKIEGRDNGIEVTAAGANSASVTISDNAVTSDESTGLEGIDINANGTGTVLVAATNNSLAGRSNAFDARTGAVGAQLQILLSNNANILSTDGSGVVIDGTGGMATIVGFSGNSVHADTTGTGIHVNNATFDQVPGGAFDQVAGGSTLIGASANGVGGGGMVLTNVQGNLGFSDLDIFSDGGAGLRIAGAGVGMTFAVAPAVGVVEAVGGPAVDVTSVALTLPLSTLKSTSSPSTGVALNSITGTFSAGTGSSIGNITSATGTAFQASNSNATISYAGTISTTAGKGVDLTSNTGSIISFTGTLTLSTGANSAFAAAGGGTVTATDTASTLTTTTGTALSVANTTIGASGLKFRSISANGAVNGIVLQDTGTSAGLTVLGNGSAGTGGTITSSTNAGIALTNTGAVSLAYMNIQNGGDDGIRGSGVNGLNLTGVNIASNGNAAGERGIDIAQLTGSGSMANCTISDSAESNVVIANTSGSLSAFNVTSSSFTSTNMTTGDDGFRIENNGSGSMTVSITGSTFTDNKGDHFQASTSASATGSIGINFNNNTLATTAANDPNVVGGGITLSPSGSADLTFTISNNNIQQAFDEAINLNLGTASTASASMIGTVSNNTIGTAADPDSGSESGTGISVISNGAGLTTVAITGNQVRQYSNPYGILVNIKEGSSSMNATITNNTVSNPGSFAINGIRVDAGATTGDSGTLCAAVTGNSVAGSGPGADTDIRLRQRFNTTIKLPGYSGGNSATTAVNSFVAGNNTGADVSSSHNVSGGGGGFIGGSACPLP